MSAAPAGGGAPTGLHVLVTGGAGFVGRHVVAALLGAGHRVTVADLDVADPAAPTVVGDLTDSRVRERAVTADVDAVVHLAAATSVLGSIERPAEVHRTNVDVTAGLLELARTQGVGAFVLASTNAVVGDVGATTITEDLPLAPLTPYGASKAAAEMLLHGYAGAYGIRTPIVRLTNVYGPGMAHKDSLVPRLMRAAASGGGVQVYGDGEQRRDLVHVADAARALALAVTDWPTGPVIIGGSRSYTVNEIVQVARDVTCRPIPAERIPPKPGEMPAVVVDVGRARARGYAPTTSLADGIRTAWADFSGTPPVREPVDARR